ncbi:hypothetical protein BGX38DRAFT_1308368 [Terfezia claveryi]|nr:hypothetical protein BGX38DRAFT_1308368 [Terfezia claveryi]
MNLPVNRPPTGKKSEIYLIKHYADCIDPHKWTPPPPVSLTPSPPLLLIIPLPSSVKACPLPIDGQLSSSPTPGSDQVQKSSSTEKRRRLASDVCALLRDELESHWVMDEGFLDRFLLGHKWTPNEEAADLILKRLAAERVDVIWDSQEGDWFGAEV